MLICWMLLTSGITPSTPDTLLSCVHSFINKPIPSMDLDSDGSVNVSADSIVYFCRDSMGSLNEVNSPCFGTS